MSAHAKNHDYHIINPSKWPFVAAVGAFLMLSGLIFWFGARRAGEDHFPILPILGLLIILYVMYGWWKDVVHESRAGDHTPVVRIGLRYGFILFIISEVFFFVAWFWGYFNFALFPPNLEVMADAGTYDYFLLAENFDHAEDKGAFPPASVHAVGPWGLPFINTLILLLSGCTLTWAHHALIEAREGAADYEAKRKEMMTGLTITVILGFIFLFLQAYEYVLGYSHGLTLQNSYYGAAFYMATGFHGMHVLIGAIFLTVCLFRARKGDFTARKHIGFEAAAWYWHFVDVVWLFLFIMVYLGSVYFFATGGAH